MAEQVTYYCQCLNKHWWRWYDGNEDWEQCPTCGDEWDAAWKKYTFADCLAREGRLSFEQGLAEKARKGATNG